MCVGRVLGGADNKPEGRCCSLTAPLLRPSPNLPNPTNQPSTHAAHAAHRSTHLDVAARVEAVQLVDNLQHRALHLVVAARAVVKARAAWETGVAQGTRREDSREQRRVRGC
jgi:hypothetical protein